MNSADKNSLLAFKSMFGALSQSVKRKFERQAAVAEIRANDRSAESGIPTYLFTGNPVGSDGDRRDETPPLASAAVEQRGANVVSLAGVAAAKARSRSPQHP